MNHQIAMAQDGQPSAPSERMIASMLFTRGANLLLALETLLKAGLGLEGAALLRSMLENAADACYIAGHETETPTALADRLIAFQPVSRVAWFKEQVKAGLNVDAEACAAARAGRAHFFANYRIAGDEHDWAGVKAYVKLPYVLQRLRVLDPQAQTLMKHGVVPYLHEFVHDGPVVWQQLIDQSERRIKYRIGEQDHPVMMQFAVPLAVGLSAATAHAAAILWQRADLVSFVERELVAAVAYLETAASQPAA